MTNFIRNTSTDLTLKSRQFILIYNNLIPMQIQQSNYPQLSFFQELRKQQPELLKSAQIVSSQCVEYLKSVIRNLNKKDNAQLMSSQWQQFLALKPIVTKSHLCSQILVKGMKAFKCRQCMLEDNSILCIQCFDKSDHEGHFYQLIEVYGGCCDCGDDEKWQQKGFCTKHNPQNGFFEVDQDSMQLFVKKMQFCLYLLFMFYNIEDSYQQIATEKYTQTRHYGTFIIKKLLQFNKDSLISNHMTANLLLSEFPKHYKPLKCLGGTQHSNSGIIAQLFIFEGVDEVAEQLSDLYISIFAVKSFKKILTEEFMKKFNSSPYLVKSNFSSLSCQLYTSHKMINEIIQERKIDPVQYSPDPKQQFQNIANNCVRFYIDIDYLSRLYKGVNIKYLKYYFFDRGNICHMASYRKKAEQEFENSIDYYGLEGIYLNKLAKIIKALKKNPDILKKMIKDLYNFCANYKIEKHSRATVFIPQERTLALCIFAYLQGEIQVLEDPLRCDQLIEVMAISANWQQEFNSISKHLSEVLKLQSTVLASRKKLERYFTFYSCTFQKNNLLLSLDTILYWTLNQISKRKQKRIGDFISFQSIGSVFPNHYSQMESEQDREQRKHLILNTIERLGLITQMACTFLPKLVLSTILEFPQKAQLSQLYRQLLKRAGKIDLKKYKQLKEIFISEEETFEEHIKNNTNIDKKLQLDNSIEVMPLCLSYFHSRINLAKKLVPQDQFLLKETPISCFKTNKAADFYSQSHVQVIIELTGAYIQFLTTHIKEDEVCMLNSLLWQLLKIKHLLKSEGWRFDKFFKEIREQEECWKMLSNNIQSEISSLLPKKDVLSNQEREQHKQATQRAQLQRKEKIKLIQKNKMEQLRKKQKRVSKKFESEEFQHKQQYRQINTMEDNQTNCCMVCRDSGQKTPLFYLTLLHRQNTYSRVFKNTKQSNLVFTSCYHTIHLPCFFKTYGNRQYVYCVLCKSAANVFIPADPLDKNAVDYFSPCVQRLEIVNAVLKVRSQGQKQETNKQKITVNIQIPIKDQILNSIIAISLSSGLAHPQAFEKKLKKIYYLLLLLYCNLVGQDKFVGQLHCKEADLKKAILANDQPFVQQTKTLQICLIQHLIAYITHTSGEKHPLTNEQYPEIGMLVQNILTEPSILPSQTLSTNQDFLHRIETSIYNIPEELTQLSKNIGRCPQCNHASSLIYLCLLCLWRGCQGCKIQKVMTHAQTEHQTISVFVRVDTGKILYTAGQKGLIEESIYQNFLEEPYTEGNLCRNKYRRNNEKYGKLLQRIYGHQIQKHIRYLQVTKNKALGTHAL